MTRLALRSISVAGAAMTAGYALLCASPFTFHDFIRSNMFGVAGFARWHWLFYWAWFLVAVTDARTAASRRRGPWLPFAVAGISVGLYNTFLPILPALTDDWRSLLVADVALAAIIWLAAVDHWAARSLLSSAPAQSAEDANRVEGQLLISALGGAGVLAFVSSALVPLLMRGQFEPDLLSTGLSLGLLWTLVTLSVVACQGFLALALLLRIIRSESMPRQYGVLLVALAGVTSIAVDRTIGSTLGFVGAGRAWVDGMAALAIVTSWGALRLRQSMRAEARLTSPIQVFFGGPRPADNLRALLVVGAVVASIYGATVFSRRFDWDFLLLETAVAIVWLAITAYIFRVAPTRSLGGLALAAACLVPFAAWQATRWIDGRLPDTRRSLNRYVIYSGPMRLADDLLHRPTGAVPAFQRYLRENSGLANLDVKPVSLDFVAPLERAPRQPPPHIFLFVIDSLRPDYLAPYNRAVTFTPNIAQLATDSLVFRNAMTRYGATGLSLPAIWSGAVSPHKQYVTPFWPMNTLEKLLDANAYTRLMSVDVLMEQLLRPRSDIVHLDQGRRTLDYDLCETLAELETRLPAIGPGQPAVFAYSNPQNLHLSNLMSASVPAGETYPGFHAPYAARVHAIDRCLGRFVEFLKQRDAYDRSVVVLTSDHGELLGEEGRWGHAYYLFPQILRIPLIVHLPREHRSEIADRADLDALSLSTDIAPTMYAALGYEPRAENSLMGESLIRSTSTSARGRRRGDYVVEASYSAVYGVVRRNGRRVYIVDAVSGSEYAYHRDGENGWKGMPVVEGIREPAQRIIREHVDHVRRVFHMPAYR